MYIHVHVKHTRVRIDGGTLKQYTGGTIGERTIDHIGVTSDPANVSHTCIDISRTVVKHILWAEGEEQCEMLATPTPVIAASTQEGHTHLLGDRGVEQVACLGVHDALGLASGA